MRPRFLVYLLFAWMCSTIVVSNNTLEVQDVITNNPEEGEIQPSKSNSVNNGGQPVSVEHINKVLQTLGENLIQQSFGSDCIDGYIQGYHRVFNGNNCHVEIAEALNSKVQELCSKCTVSWEKVVKPSAVICISTNSLKEICHESDFDVDCSSPIRVILNCSEEQTPVLTHPTPPCPDEDSVTGTVIGAVLSGLVIGVILPPVICLFIHFRKEKCILCYFMFDKKKPQNTSYQVRLSTIGDGAYPRSDDDELDKYTTIQDAEQIRSTGNVYRDTIHETIPKPQSLNGHIPNIDSDTPYSDGAFQTSSEEKDVYKDPCSVEKSPKRYSDDYTMPNQFKRATSITSREITNEYPSYVTVVGEGDYKNFEVFHKCSSCNKKSLFKITQKEMETEEIQLTEEKMIEDDTESTPNSVYFMSEQSEDRDIHHYKKMNESVSEL